MPGLPKSNVFAINNGLGNVPDSPAQTQLKVGPAISGPFLTLTFPPSKTDLAQTFTGSVMPEAAGTAMNERGRGIVGVIRTVASTPGSSSAVTKTDPAGAVGTPVVIGGVTFTAIAPGYTARIVVAGMSTPLSVPPVVGGAIIINSATDAGGAATSTQSTVAAALAAEPTAAAGAVATPGATVVSAGGPTALPFGSTAAMTVTVGTANDAYVVRILTTVGGALGTAQARWSLDDGKVYSDPFLIPVGGVYVIPNTGLTVTFTGVLAVGDAFSFTCSAPSSTLSDFSAAMDYLLLPTITDSFSLIHLVTEIGSASLAAFFVAMGSYADQLETAHHDVRIFIECARPTSSQTTAQWATAFKAVMATLSHPRLSVWMMTEDLTASLDGAQRGRTMRRSAAWPGSARAGAFPVGRDIGDQSYGQPLSGVSKVYELDQGEQLALARFSCLYALPGVPGFHAEGRLADAPTGDYTYLQYGRLIDEVQRLGYQLQTTKLSSASRRRTKASGIYPAGSIDPRSANSIEFFLTIKLRQALVATGQCTAVIAQVDRTITSARLKVSYRCVPLIYFKQIDGDAQLVLSTDVTTV